MLYLVRYSEIGLKGRRKRAQMEEHLISNIRAAFVGKTECDFSFEQGRIFVTFPDDTDPEVVKTNLGKVFGVKSFSRCTPVSITDLNDLTVKARDFFRDIMEGKKFAVRVRRAGTHNFTSIDAERSIGEALLPFGSGVDLVRPEVTAFVEVRANSAYFFTESHSGSGGFPLGTQGKMVSLVSGGIDSPVATWMMMKRGCVPEIVFCSLAHPVDTVEFGRTIAPLVKDWSHGVDFDIHIFDGRALVDLLVGGRGFKHPNVGYKKFLYRLAETIVSRTRAYGIITGESLGQVSSQTAENLYALSLTVKTPVHRPLIGLDKDEIVEIAKRIGTFPDVSLGEFCSIFAVNPSIAVDPDQLSQDIVPESVFSDILRSEITVKKSEFTEFLNGLKGSDLKVPESRTEGVLVDLRSKEEYRKWHPEEAINVSVSEIAGIPDRYGRENTYLFYCSKGLMSAFAASKFVGMGINALYTDENKIKKIYKKNKI